MKHLAVAAEYAGIMTGGPLFAVGWMWFWLEGIGDLAAAARLARRITRAAFLAIGWAVAVGRLIL